MSSEQTDQRPVRRPSRIGATLKALVRTRVTAGLLVVLPIWVTILLIKFVFGLMRDSSQWVVEWGLHSELIARIVRSFGVKWEAFEPEGAGVDARTLEKVLEQYPTLDWGIAIFSVALTIFLLYIIGLFAANIFGRRLIDLFEHLLDRVPLVKTIYRSTKQIIATFTGDQSKSFQRVALIPFPQEKMRSVGFITAVFRDSVTNEELAAVFIPTTPNPTTGYLLVLRRAELVELDWSVEDAVRTIMSGGILRPDFLTIVPTAQLEDVKNLPPAIARRLKNRPSAAE
ncbi:MAG: DUF502 domain-containing protein [Planctomycetes bacterium]|nr:DUF502 domain-containing protein [Planctomycetota bacterium]